MAIEDEWTWGWDPTPNIVSVWARSEGRVAIWRRVNGEIVVEDVAFRPWVVVAKPPTARNVTVRELAGGDHYRYLVRADDNRTLLDATRSQGDFLAIPPEEQYLVATGRNYFRTTSFDRLRRIQLDLETTGLDPARDAIFLIALRTPDGEVEFLEGDERQIIIDLVARVTALDPDVIENHNLHGFDLPFLEKRARHHGVPLLLGRAGALRERPSRKSRTRFTAPGRELIDTMDAVLRYDFSTRELPSHGLKAVAKHLGLATEDRELIPGDQIAETYRRDPDRVKRYAGADVVEVEGVARLLGGAAFALATMCPRRYERLADAGAATGVIDPMLVRAYLRSGTSIPAHRAGDGTVHEGAALHIFASGVATKVVKADVASLYPSLMRQYRIGSSRDRLGALLAIVDRIVEQRLAAKRAGNAPLSAALKLIVNSAYGYLAAGELVRFSDVHAANEITRRGRELLGFMCAEIEQRGGTLIEADTDGVFFSCESDDAAVGRRIVDEVAALLPPLVKLELEGRYAAMLSHEPKNYALRTYDHAILLRGVAFRSSRGEPFGDAFLRTALDRLFANDIRGIRAAYLDTIDRLRKRQIPTRDVASRMRLSKPPSEYLATRDSRRELAYEAMVLAGRTEWAANERVLVYRARTAPRLLVDDARDYDVDHYLRVLRDNFASRLARAFAPEDYAAIFEDPDQLSLFAKPLDGIAPVLTILRWASAAGTGVVVGELAIRRDDHANAGTIGEPVGLEPAVEPIDEIDAGDTDAIA